jgi:hypothetical protein
MDGAIFVAQRLDEGLNGGLRVLLGQLANVGDYRWSPSQIA